MIRRDTAFMKQCEPAGATLAGKNAQNQYHKCPVGFRQASIAVQTITGGNKNKNDVKKESRAYKS